MTQLDNDLQIDTGAQLEEKLTKAGLPLNYPKLTGEDQKAARSKVFSSWWDPKQPNVLVTDLEKYLQSHYLFVEFLIKPSEIGQGIYYFPDASNKYDMIKMVMNESLDSRVNKSIVTATRRTGKTQGIIYEAMSHICITRPYSLCLLSEVQEKRTLEEIRKIKALVENNDRIHQEFGGVGELYPKASQGSWSSHELRFLHYPGCCIMGHSLGSAQRGRGPIYGVVDDPEDEETTFNQDWRIDFFNKLLSVYCKMFTKGGKLCWIGTPIHAGSALALAMKGKSESVDTGIEASVDKRFKDWRKGNFSIIQKDTEGQWVACQPARYSLHDFMRDMEIDPITTQKEVLCLPVTPGARAFKYDPYLHGFMICVQTPETGGFNYPNGTQYVIDLKTGQEWPLANFLQRLKIVGGSDEATGASDEADPGAVTFVGMDTGGTVYVLDCWTNRVFEDIQIKIVYEIAEEWKASIVGWEKSGLLITILRQAKRYLDELKTAGKHAPEFVPIDNHKKKKEGRILSMMPLFGHQDIRLRQLEKFQGTDGRIHHPAPYPRWGMYLELLAQIQEYTDQGIKGHDDCIDSLEMAVRVVNPKKVEIGVDQPKDQVEQLLMKWNKIGIRVTRDNLPVEFQKDPIIPTRTNRIVLPYV